jgi:hypothetical protein
MWTSDFAVVWMCRKLELAIDRIEKSIRQKEPTVGRIFIEVDSLRTNIGILDRGQTKKSW